MKKLIFALILALLFLIKLNAQTIIKMQNEGGVYTMPCEVNGLKLRFIFDTGASNVCISLSEAAFMLKNGYLDEDDLHGSSYSQIANGDIVENTTVNIREMEIGGIELHNIEAIIIHELDAPLLLGQSAIQQLGKIQIDGNELIIVNAIESSEQKVEPLVQISDLQDECCSYIDYGNLYWESKEGHQELVQIFTHCAEMGSVEAQCQLGIYLLIENEFHGDEKEHKQAYKWLKSSAEQGNAEAQFYLASMLQLGNGVTKDHDKAQYWYKQSGENGFSYGQRELGRSYEEGDGLPLDYSRAMYWYKKSAEQDHYAAFDLGNMYFYGIGVDKNYKQAIYWYEKMSLNYFQQIQDSAIINMIKGYAEQGLGEAQFMMWKEYWYSDAKQATSWLKKAAEKWCRKAQSKLGELYFMGNELSKNYKQAEYWYKQAAEQGDIFAQLNLGHIYKGNDVEVTMSTRINSSSGDVKIPIDYEKAFYWYKKAADQGDRDALFCLSNMYYNGEGVTQDYEQAFQLYRKAAEQGDRDSQYMLGSMYDFGRGTNKDSQQAINWYKKAGVNGDTDAQLSLGYIFIEHQDYKQAFFWFEKAARHEDSGAQYKMGLMYDLGRGILKDYKQAVYWYRKAAEQEHEAAQHSLGVMYLSGYGVSINKKDAAFWIKKSYENGYEEAKEIWDEYELWKYLN